MPATIHSFPTTSALPGELCFDTSFVLEVFFAPDDPYQKLPTRIKDSAEFFNKILRETPKRYITTTVHAEMLEKIIEDVLCGCLYNRARIKYGARQVWKEYYKANKSEIRDIDRKLNEAIEKFHQWQGDHGVFTLPFRYDPNTSIITSEKKAVFLEIVEYCKRFKILPDDARIIIEARHQGVNNFVSLDKDFKNVEGITVFMHSMTPNIIS